MSSKLIRQNGYSKLLQDLKAKIHHARVRAGLAINRELILLYWQIGREILIQQEQTAWGTRVVEKLAQDLRTGFPDMKGFSSRNLKYMRAFAHAYSDWEFVQAWPAQISWHHNCTLLDKVKSVDQRIWYIEKTIQHGWTRDVMVHQIESDLYKRQGNAVTNFGSTLPSPQSELVQQTIKDPYLFDFVGLSEPAKERELESALILKLRKFLLELGSGFAFMGSQYHFELDGDDFYIDLLFYHHRLRCLVAIDLKIDDFKPEYAGKMNFYLSALDELVKHPDDQPSVGIILCKGKKKTVGEYALRDMSKPIGLSTYKLTESLPKSWRASLPSIEELQAQIEED